MRNVPSSFNESSWIGLSVYNIAVCCAVVLAALFAFSSTPSAVFTVRGIVIAWCTAATAALLVAVKALAVWQGITNADVQRSVTNESSDAFSPQARSAAPSVPRGLSAPAKAPALVKNSSTGAGSTLSKVFPAVQARARGHGPAEPPSALIISPGLNSRRAPSLMSPTTIRLKLGSDEQTVQPPSLSAQLKAVKAQVEALQGLCAQQGSSGGSQRLSEATYAGGAVEWLTAVESFTAASSERLTALMAAAAEADQVPRSLLSPGSIDESSEPME